jgi:hypothetical protein
MSVLMSSIFLSILGILLCVFSSIVISCCYRPVMHRKFGLQPLHVHFRFWIVSSFRADNRADNRAGEMLLYSIQKLNSHTQHDMHSCFLFECDVTFQACIAANSLSFVSGFGFYDGG